MKLFDVYPLLPLSIEKAMGSRLWDDKGEEYLDFYGGHAVISIGHSHSAYVQAIKSQLEKIGFYSNAVINPLQEKLAEKLGKLSGYGDYSLFLVNSGAEANENAFKTASFLSGKKKFISFRNSFHGRTSASVAATDDPSIIAPVNVSENFVFCPFNDIETFETLFYRNKEDLAGVITEGIQGIGGIHIPSKDFIKRIEQLCRELGVFFICDEIQSGYGRTGKFFAHQYFEVRPDIITVAKGMGNGFPIGGVLFSSHIEARKKMLGTTFGGNHLACSAALAVLEVMERENLIVRSYEKGQYLLDSLTKFRKIKEIRGRGLMIALDFDFSASGVSRLLREKYKILVDSAKNSHTIRLLPPLGITEEEIDYFLISLSHILGERSPFAE
ncbi:MAG: aspartate aminotransferase family protein [Bergeyella sp.]|nr:aspartate aminotransferase family protein [Bergeyella sp.]